MYPSLNDRSAIVTGGANGIGAAVVKAMLDQGMRVVSLDLDSGEQHERLLEIQVNLCDTKALQEAAYVALEHLGGADVLVNNAGYDARTKWDEITPEQWSRLIDVNLTHFFFLSQIVAKRMILRGRGSIINLSSTVGRLMEGGMTEYTVAKGGVEALTRSMARDLGCHNIRVNTLSPGWVMTERQKRDNYTPEAAEWAKERRCLQGDIEPVDIANMALFLAADESRFCTGQTFTVDGGWV